MRTRGILVVLICLWATADAEGKDSIRDSVVKIYSTQRQPDFMRPWTKSAPQESVASGVIIEGKRILTNAHVVHFATQIFIQANGSTEKLTAQVIAVGQDVDLAVLRPEDETFFAEHPPLLLADGIARVKDKVNVYGYPVGGDQLSVTEGVVSRIDYASFSVGHGLRIQVDAALNPGNSGGPAISDGRIVGVVFSKLLEAENIGYVLAVDEIKMFLKGIADGNYRGKPILLDQMQTVENEALRAKLHLDKNTGGIMVTEPYSKEPGYPLKTADVITEIGSHKLDKQGNVRVGDDLWLPYSYIIPKLAQHNKVPVTLVRDGKPLKVEVPVTAEVPSLVPPLNGKYPRYFVHGPLVFMGASQDLVRSLSSKWLTYLILKDSPLFGRLSQWQGRPTEELVVLGYSLLNHRIAKGYEPQPYAVVSHVNETAVRNLSHLVELLRDAKTEYITFRFAGRYETLVFRRDELDKSTEEILANEDIRSRGSEDLLKIWRKGK
jgi:S1-C subfamily serine protease